MAQSKFKSFVVSLLFLMFPIGALAQNPFEKIDKQFDEYLQLKQYDKLKQTIETIVFDHKYDKYSMGRVYELILRDSAAVDYFKNAAKNNPEDAIPQDILCSLFSRQSQLDKSLSACENAVKLKPDFYRAYLNLGLTQVSLKKYDDALLSYQKSLDLNPGFVLALNRKYSLLLQMGKLEEASQLMQVIELKDPSAENYMQVGGDLARQGKNQEAVSFFNKAVAMDPKYKVAYFALGVTYNNLGKRGEAIAAYQKAIVADPDYAEAYYNMGDVYRFEAKMDEANRALEKAFSIWENRLKADKDYFAKDAGAKPLYMALKAYFGKSRGSANSLLDAKERLDGFLKQVALYPTDGQSHFNVATEYYRQLNYEEANKAFRKVLELLPDKYEVYVYLGYSLLMTKQVEEARAMAEKVNQLPIDNPALLMTIGQTNMMLKNYNEAAKAFNKMLELDSSSVDAACLLVELNGQIHNEADLKKYSKLLLQLGDTKLKTNPEFFDQSPRCKSLFDFAKAHESDFTR